MRSPLRPVRGNHPSAFRNRMLRRIKAKMGPHEAVWQRLAKLYQLCVTQLLSHAADGQLSHETYSLCLSSLGALAGGSGGDAWGRWWGSFGRPPRPSSSVR